MAAAGNDNTKIVRFNGYSRLDWSTEEIFRAALANKVTDVIVIGRHPDGVIYLDHGQADHAKVNWMLDKIKNFILETID